MYDQGNGQGQGQGQGQTEEGAVFSAFQAELREGIESLMVPINVP